MRPVGITLLSTNLHGTQRSMGPKRIAAFCQFPGSTIMRMLSLVRLSRWACRSVSPTAWLLRIMASRWVFNVCRWFWQKGLGLRIHGWLMIMAWTDCRDHAGPGRPVFVIWRGGLALSGPENGGSRLPERPASRRPDGQWAV